MGLAADQAEELSIREEAEQLLFVQSDGTFPGLEDRFGEGAWARTNTTIPERTVPLTTLALVTAPLFAGWVTRYGDARSSFRRVNYQGNDLSTYNSLLAEYQRARRDTFLYGGVTVLSGALLTTWTVVSWEHDIDAGFVTQRQIRKAVKEDRRLSAEFLGDGAAVILELDL